MPGKVEIFDPLSLGTIEDDGEDFLGLLIQEEDSDVEPEVDLSLKSFLQTFMGLT